MSEPDGRADEEDFLAPRPAPGPPGRRRCGTCEVAKQQVDPDGIAHFRQVTRAFEENESSSDSIGECCTLTGGANEIFGAVDHESRTPDATERVPQLIDAEVSYRLGRIYEGLRGRLECPPDGILDRLRRMGLVEALEKKNLKEVLVVLHPVVPVVLRPALVFVVLLVKIEERALGAVRSDPDGRGDVDDLLHPTWMVSRQLR